MSIYSVPFNIESRDLDNNMPNLGGISTTTISITILSAGIWDKDATTSLIKTKHLTFLESK